MNQSWIDREANVRVFGAQLADSVRRGLRRPFLGLLCTILSALAIVGAIAVKEQKFAPRYILRAVEADRDAHTAPRPKRRLRDHVMNAVYTNNRLLELMERHGLYDNLRKANPQAAIESFREDIQIDVYRNYFVEERSQQAPPRSARIVVRYFAGDPKVAVTVTHDLGRLIVEHESTMRRAQAQQAAATATNLVAKAREKLFTLQEQIMQREVDPNFDRENFVRLVALRRAAQNLELVVQAAEHRKAAFDIGAVVESKNLGLEFEVVDQGAVPGSAIIDGAELTNIGIISFACLWPLISILLGAFDSRIRTTRDIERIGLTPLGRLPFIKALGGPS